MGINTIEPLYKSPSCQIRVGHFQMTGIGPGKGWGPGEGSSKAEIPVNGATCTPQMSLRRRKERESGKGKGNHRVWKLINSIHRIWIQPEEQTESDQDFNLRTLFAKWMKHVSTPWLPRSRDSAAGSKLQRALSRNVDGRVPVYPPDPRSSGCWLFLLLSMSKVKAASHIWTVSFEGFLCTCRSPSNMPRIGLGGDCCCAHFTANNAGCSRLHQITHSSLFWPRSL